MRGLVVREFGPLDSHKIEELPTPALADDAVLIDVHAIGLNFPDTLMLQGKYQTRPERPFVAGRDAAGVVRAVGRAVTRCRPGDRVSAQVAWGAFAEQLAAPQSRVFVLPHDIDFATAAGMVTIYNTAYVAVFTRGNVQPGETVFVTGASGGVGLAMVELAKVRGATVLAGATSRDKGKICKAHGADHWIDLSVADLHEGVRAQVAAITGDKLCNAVFDVVGGKVFDAAMRCVGYKGRMVIVGFATMNISMPKGHHILLKNISVIGAPLDIHFKMEPELMNRAVADLFALYRQKKIRPEITKKLPLDGIHTALDDIASRRVVGKIVLTTRNAA
jgi:NADPH2:quinone reductase